MPLQHLLQESVFGAQDDSHPQRHLRKFAVHFGENAILGAYYGAFVAAVMIRAGFDLALEDETDSSTAQCEFTGPLSRHWPEILGRGEIPPFPEDAA